MKTYFRTWLLVLLIAVTALMQYLLGRSDAVLTFYIRHIFLPLQKARSVLFNPLPFSLGDVLYLLLALLLVVVLIRLVYYLLTFRKNRAELKRELLRLLLVPAWIYFLFLLLWGGNYARKPLSAAWSAAPVAWNDTALISLNRELVARMNEVRRQPIRYPGLKETNRLANQLYRRRYGNRLPGLEVKPTSLGYMLNYIGIQGYYNPLSGEGQFNRFIPLFMHPFVISHEMAHQAGIAAEDDANLLAYVLGAESTIPAFRYSAYFNLFLYAYSDLKSRDSLTAKEIFATLNQQSRDDLDTLRAMQQRYRSRFRRFTSGLYDEYLRLHGQKGGIQTYSEVSRWVYIRECLPEAKRADFEVCP